MPLGLKPGMDYEEISFQFEPGDCALLHSDGLAEAQAPDREMFGFPRVAELVGKGLAGATAAVAASRPGPGRRAAARPGPGPDPRTNSGRADPDREHHHDGQLA